eukprot:TRINITY_DN20699_c0_g1_i1.p1 TRINITY_DN20699_c0_g1~~TRINITY_DN20699_c0_g1_i1.p1  ORF type:complete len:333 (-),score=44.16 TRINITY_DN20699_c0_g1_i1:109-1107(-)
MGSDTDDDNEKQMRGKSNSSSIRALTCFAFVIFCAGCIYKLKKRSSSAETPETPEPPKPYEYNAFMDWLRKTDSSHVDSWKWKPEVSEFDLDAPAQSGKFASSLVDADGKAAVSLAKHINKFLFLSDIMKTGEIDQVGAPGLHLYAIKKLAIASCSHKKPDSPVFIDVGCGPGYLLMAWALACGSGSRAVGFDVNKRVVSNARTNLASADSLDIASKGKTAGASFDVHVGDALRPTPSETLVKPGTAHAINVGVALRSVQDSPLPALLAEGGMLLAPICDGEQPKDIPAGKCAAHLTMFEKKGDGTLTEVADAHGPIPVRFVLPETGTNLRH